MVLISVAYKLNCSLVAMTESHAHSRSQRRRRKARHRKSKLISSQPQNSPRSVYIVSRPVTKARYLHLSSLSERKFSLSHWALLISPYNEIELKQHIQSQGDSNVLWGSLFEMFNIDGIVDVHVVEDFGQNLPTEWRYAFMMHIGKTQLEDKEIIRCGIFH